MILVFTKVTCRNFSYVLATIIQYCQQKKSPLHICGYVLFGGSVPPILFKFPFTEKSKMDA